jgi:hypothetical protein
MAAAPPRTEVERDRVGRLQGPLRAPRPRPSPETRPAPRMGVQHFAVFDLGKAGGSLSRARHGRSEFLLPPPSSLLPPPPSLLPPPSVQLLSKYSGVMNDRFVPLMSHHRAQTRLVPTYLLPRILRKLLQRNHTHSLPVPNTPSANPKTSQTKSTKPPNKLNPCQR